MAKKAIVIGCGFAGLSSASFLAKAGWEVSVIEKHDGPGGRARQLKADGFTFDMGPSWYWMPDVFEKYFSKFGYDVSSLYSLRELDPAYRIYWPEGPMDIPSNLEELKQLFESLETGASKNLDRFLNEASVKYKAGMNNLVYKPGQSYAEFLDADFLKGVFQLDVFTSMRKHVARFFRHPKIRQIMEFPVLFLGALPEKIPALYSLMNYAAIVGKTWYPEGGMYSIVQAVHKVAEAQGVQFFFGEDVSSFHIVDEKITGVDSRSKDSFHFRQADVIVAGADYHFVEHELLPENLRTYSTKYWNSRTMAPSALIYYVGLNKKIKNITHHSLFFDTAFQQHADEIYATPKWPSDPLFYLSVTSVTDPGVAPEGHENLFFLIPVAAGLEGDDEELRTAYFSRIIKRLEQHTKQDIASHIVFERSFATRDFQSEYNAFKGNAYGLANTLMQTATLKPSCRSKKIENLFYTGQLTVPGPGVPPSLISGEVVAGEVVKHYGGRLSIEKL